MRPFLGEIFAVDPVPCAVDKRKPGNIVNKIKMFKTFQTSLHVFIEDAPEDFFLSSFFSLYLTTEYVKLPSHYTYNALLSCSLPNFSGPFKRFFPMRRREHVIIHSLLNTNSQQSNQCWRLVVADITWPPNVTWFLGTKMTRVPPVGLGGTWSILFHIPLVFSGNLEDAVSSVTFLPATWSDTRTILFFFCSSTWFPAAGWRSKRWQRCRVGRRLDPCAS